MRATWVRVSTRAQHVVFEEFPREGRRGVFEPDGSVRIETADGEVLAARPTRGRRSRTCGTSSGGIASTSSTSAPTRSGRTSRRRSCSRVEGYELSELEPWIEDGERWDRIGVRFPESVHTHSREQVFYVDARGRIRRHDYTAEPIGGWARAAHFCMDHERFDGLLVPTRRRVYPRRADNRPRQRPRLVWVEVTDAKVVPAS